MPGMTILAALAALAGAQVASPLPAAPVVTPAVIDDRLAVEGEALAASLASARLTVAVTVEGRGPYRFIVDTGASQSVIGARLAQALALPPGPVARVHGVTGTAQVATVKVAALGFGRATTGELILPVLSDRNLGADGMLGLDVMGDRRVMMDFDARTLTIQDADRPEGTQAGDIVVVARRRHGQLILTQARIDGIGVDAVIDTGAEVTIANAALADRLRRRRRGPPALPDILIGVTGERLEAERLDVGTLRIGDLSIGGIGMVTVDAPPFAIFGLTARPSVLLGADVLAQFKRVSLDFRRRRVRFVVRRPG